MASNHYTCHKCQKVNYDKNKHCCNEPAELCPKEFVPAPPSSCGPAIFSGTTAPDQSKLNPNYFGNIGDLCLVLDTSHLWQWDNDTLLWHDLGTNPRPTPFI